MKHNHNKNTDVYSVENYDKNIYFIQMIYVEISSIKDVYVKI